MNTIKADVFISTIDDQYTKGKRCCQGDSNPVVALIGTYIPGIDLPQVFICEQHLKTLREHLDKESCKACSTKSNTPSCKGCTCLYCKKECDFDGTQCTIVHFHRRRAKIVLP